MLSFPSSVRIYLAIEPVDMGKSFNGLYAVATEQLKKIPWKAVCSSSPTNGATV